MNESKKFDEVKKAFLVNSLIPVYIVIILGIIVGLFISLMRFNYWNFIFPFLSRLLPPILLIYLFLFGLYFIYSWSRLVLIKESLDNLNIDSLKKIITFPTLIGYISFAVWIVAAFATFVFLYVFEIIDILTIVSLSVLILGIGPIVALSLRTNLERSFSEILSNYSIDLKDNQDFSSLIADRMRRKVMYYVLSGILAVTSVLAVFSAEELSRTVKDSESQSYMNQYFQGETILNQIEWKIDETGKQTHAIIDDHIKKAILEKSDKGENILYDYLSSSVFIFAKKENTIEGIFVPLPDAENKAVTLIIIMIILSAVIQGLILVVYNTSFGRYLMESFLSLGKKLWFGGDEFTPISADLIMNKNRLEKMENKYNKIKEDAGYILSQVFSELISMRARINKIIGDIRIMKLSINRTIQLTGKEIEEFEFQLQDFAPLSVDQIDMLLKMVRDVSNLINGISVETQSLLKYTDKSILSPNISSERFIDSRFPAVETSIVKRMEMITNTMRELESSISKTSGVLKAVQENISKFRELLKMIDEILLDADRLKKKLFVLSMNISIVSGKATQEEIMEEVSSIAKQMSSLLADDLKKVEVGLKNLGGQIRSYVGNLSSELGDGFGESYIISAEGIAGRIDDIIEQLQTDVRYVIEQGNDMRKSIKEILEILSNVSSAVSKISSSISKIDQMANSSQDNIEKVSSIVGSIEEQISNLSSNMEKFHRESKNIILRYKNLVSEVGLMMKNIRGEMIKMLDSFDNFESLLSKVVSDIEKLTESIQDSMYRVSGET